MLNLIISTIVLLVLTLSLIRDIRQNPLNIIYFIISCLVFYGPIWVGITYGYMPFVIIASIGAVCVVGSYIIIRSTRSSIRTWIIGIFGLLALVLGPVASLVIAVEAWPISLWSLIAFLLAGSAALISLFFSRKRSVLQKKKWLRFVVDTALEGLRDAALAIAIGIGAVAAAQAALNIWFGFRVDDATQASARIGWMEDGVAAAYEAVHSVVDFKSLLVVLPFLILACVFAPFLPFVIPLIRFRKLLGRLCFVLLGMSSFTFFGGAATNAHFVAKYRHESKLVAQLKANDQQRAQILAAAWAEEALENLPKDKQAALTRRLEDCEKLANEYRSAYPPRYTGPECSQRYAQDLGYQASFTVHPVRTASTHGKSGQKQPALDDVVESASTKPSYGFTRRALNRTWIILFGDGAEDHPAGLHDDPQKLSAVMSKSEALVAARKAAVEFVSGSVLSFIHGSHSDQLETITRAFAEHLVSEVATKVAVEAIPSSITSLDAGRIWITHALPSGQAIGWEPKAFTEALENASLVRYEDPVGYENKSHDTWSNELGRNKAEPGFLERLPRLRR
jgi:hypothetical protein